MKRFTGLVVAVLLLGCVLTISAQEQQEALQSSEQSGGSVSKAKKNWFMSLGVGASLLQGEQDAMSLLKERVLSSGSAEFSIGKWFTPYFGSRIQLQGGLLRGWNQQDPLGGEFFLNDRGLGDYPKGTTLNPDGTVDWGKIKLKDNDGVPGFWQDFSYGLASLDFMFNLTNLYRGYYNEANTIDVVPYLGVGLSITFESETTPYYFTFATRAGMRVNFNFNPKFALFIEPQLLVVDTEFEGYRGNRATNLVGNIFVGAQYNMSKDMADNNNNHSSSHSQISVEELYYLNDRINENRALIDKQASISDDQQDWIGRLEGRLSTVENSLQDKGLSSSVHKCLPECVYFTLNSARIPIFEQQKLAEAARYLQLNPNSKLMLLGYSDRKTGDAAYNLSLSKKRVEVVAEAFKKLGIPANRLILEWKGDQEQPFQQNDWNRVVVLVERK